MYSINSYVHRKPYVEKQVPVPQITLSLFLLEELYAQKIIHYFSISFIIALRLKEQCQILIIGIVITYPFNCIYLLDLLGMITIEK